MANATSTVNYVTLTLSALQQNIEICNPTIE
jgi:hypothetical protein